MSKTEAPNVIRTNKTYTIVPNNIIENDEISAKALGLMCYLLSFQDSWQFYINEIAKAFTDGLHSVRMGLNELEDAGYIRRTKMRDENGCTYYEWDILPDDSKEPLTLEFAQPARKAPKRFKKPTPEEVTEYGKEISFAVDGEGFCDFYESKGWRVGQTPMKDWKSAVRQWKRRNGTQQPAQQQQVKKLMGL